LGLPRTASSIAASASTGIRFAKSIFPARRIYAQQ
jgi:hypothetical protein